MTTEQQTSLYPTLLSASQTIEMKNVQDRSADDLKNITNSQMAAFVTENLCNLNRSLDEAASQLKTELKVEENIIAMVRYLKNYGKFNGIQIQDGKLKWGLSKKFSELAEKKPISRKEATELYHILKRGTIFARRYHSGWYMGMVVKKPHNTNDKINIVYEDGQQQHWDNQQHCIQDAMRGQWVLLH